ncbi:MAG: alpha/beta fold hydrolase [Alphaproteobacteria bacterium]|jgi:pimeloyl-ACP methyl ester carboxylesterase|nr:alpha/beta fold hydrolase [Alphaproteobacteria bacterium]
MPRSPLVLLPGLLNTRRVYEHQVEALQDIADIVVPELWHDDTIGAMAETALAAAPPTFALCGFSMGGYVAFEIFRRAPTRVERIALIDTQAAPDSPESRTRRQAFIEQTRLGRFHGVHPTLLPQIIHPTRLKDAAVTQPILDMAKEIGGDGFVRQQQAILGRADSRPLLVEIEVPAVVIVGRQDMATPLPRSQQMATDIANAQLVILEECGHVSPLERPAEVSAALRRWLTQ